MLITFAEWTWEHKEKASEDAWVGGLQSDAIHSMCMK